ncbi:hypothetical protein V6N13_116910 [Hibiscus sabdariffa]
MIEGKAQWNERKVKQVFMERDAQIILQCPIASTREDVLRWSHHSSGLYVTKTAHHWLEKQGNHNEGSSELWKTLARMDVLPKIRIFGWRLGYEALPVVRECPKTQEVLALSGLDSKLPQGPFLTGKQWLEAAMTTLDSKQFQFLIILLWNVWNRRNRWVHQNQLLPTKMVAEYVQLLAGEYQAANDQRT